MTPEQYSYVYLKFNKQLIYFAQCYLHGRELAEDKVSEAFLSLWNNRDIFDPIGVTHDHNLVIRQIRSWLYTKTKNDCINHLRDQSRKNNKQEEIIILSEQTETIEIRSALLDRISQEIESFTGNKREILRLYKEGYSAVQIGKILNLSHDTCRTQYWRFKEHMRRVFQIEYPGETIWEI